jgi:hypothetical protein
VGSVRVSDRVEVCEDSNAAMRVYGECGRKSTRAYLHKDLQSARRCAGGFARSAAPGLGCGGARPPSTARSTLIREVDKRGGRGREGEGGGGGRKKVRNIRQEFTANNTQNETSTRRNRGYEISQSEERGIHDTEHNTRRTPGRCFHRARIEARKSSLRRTREERNHRLCS